MNLFEKIVLVVLLGSFSMTSWIFYVKLFQHKGNYSVQCAVVTPSGPVPTVSLKGKDVVVTDFGIVKMKEGLYIPTVSEICLIKKDGE